MFPTQRFASPNMSLNEVDNGFEEVSRLRPCKSLPAETSSSRVIPERAASVCGSRHSHLFSWSGGDGATSKPSTASGFSNTAETARSPSPKGAISITPYLKKWATIGRAYQSTAAAQNNSITPDTSLSTQDSELWLDPPRPARPGME